MIKKKVTAFALALFAAAAVFGLSFMGARMGTVDSAKTLSENAAYEVSAQSIAVPGFEAIPMKADQEEQVVNFYNPSGNCCYFELSLILDGEELFTSGLIAPGEELKDIHLTHPLAAGVYYDARLRYRSFDLNSMEELNGAEVITILEVRT